MNHLGAALVLLSSVFGLPSNATSTEALTSTVLDSGRLIVFSRGEPVATEDFQFETRHDSTFVTSRVDRHTRAADGSINPYVKSMELIVHTSDEAVLAYLSTEKFDGHEINRMVSPTDTAVTVSIEKDGYGTADKLERLPGRIYVMDAGMFTLFDVIARNLHGRIFGPRPIALVALGTVNAALNATAAPAGRDTLRWGAKKVIADRITITDSTSVFVLYTSPAGNLLRLENAATDLVVMRQPPAVPAAARRRRPPLPR